MRSTSELRNACNEYIIYGYINGEIIVLFLHPAQTPYAMTTILGGRSRGLLPSRQQAHSFIRLYATSRSDPSSGQLKRQLAIIDSLNPPKSTFPPPLSLPDRQGLNTAVYYFRLGRAYGSFYWAGVKAVWANHKNVAELKRRLREGPAKELNGSIFGPDLLLACTKEIAHGQGLTRSEFQMLLRDKHDWSRVPVFGLLAAVFGEWLPLLVPFIPRAVPMTCRIPGQVAGLRKIAEERRRNVFREGKIAEPSGTTVEELQSRIKGANGQSSAPQTSKTALMPSTEIERQVLLNSNLVAVLDPRQMLFVSTSFGLHRRIYERLGTAPTTGSLRRNITGRLTYLSIDDTLLLKQPNPEELLDDDEVLLACEDRGMDVLGIPVKQLRTNLGKWLRGRKDDDGTGKVLLRMLFRR